MYLTYMHGDFVLMRKKNFTIIASPKMPIKYVLEYEGKNPFPC